MDGSVESVIKIIMCGRWGGGVSASSPSSVFNNITFAA